MTLSPPPLPDTYAELPEEEMPIYNLKAVVNETGLKPDTLRAWERRYGLPSPDRTSGGHRLYSQRDIELLKWLVARQEEGMSISRAAKLWHSLRHTGRNPLDELVNTAEETAVTRPGPTTAVANPHIPVPETTAVADTRQAWIDACLRFDERTADAILAQAFAIFPIETVCYTILQKALAEIGNGWYEGNVTVQQEHFASALAVRRLETLVAATPPPTRAGRILLACPPEERHTFSLLMVALFLRRAGWDVVYLGANVPLDKLNTTITTTQPRLVILAAQTLYTASTLLAMTLELWRERIPVAYGGAVFNFLPQLRQHIPAYFLGEKLETVATTSEQLILHPPPPPTYQPIPPHYAVALEHYKNRQAAIEALVWQQLETDGGDVSFLKNANKDLAQNIVAALAFGDMNLLTTNIEWVHGLLMNFHYRMPEQAMHRYMGAYYHACQQTLDERGQPLRAWLEATLRGEVGSMN